MSDPNEADRATARLLAKMTGGLREVDPGPASRPAVESTAGPVRRLLVETGVDSHPVGIFPPAGLPTSQVPPTPVGGFDGLADRFRAWGLSESAARAAAARGYDGNERAARAAWSTNTPAREATPPVDDMNAAVHELAEAMVVAGASRGDAVAYASRQAADCRRWYADPAERVAAVRRSATIARDVAARGAR